MQPHGEGVGGPLEVALVKGVVQPQPDVGTQGETVQQFLQAFVVVGADLPQRLDAVGVKELFLDGIHGQHLTINDF